MCIRDSNQRERSSCSCLLTGRHRCNSRPAVTPAACRLRVADFDQFDVEKACRLPWSICSRGWVSGHNTPQCPLKHVQVFDTERECGSRRPPLHSIEARAQQ
eukprot:TRINITY_DN4844_c0_g1_i1.p2 TRINITY_DN4844_c0_g1~~TRINITY_DN4844_c0_g1_i1.p2  ORF type:complete len:102 (+),score=11.53 TRINITY_DN4844_c0_g1_i1:116-421(+)